MHTRRLFTDSPQVHLLATRACRQVFRRDLVVDTLGGTPIAAWAADEFADACERAGLSVRRGRDVIEVGPGMADVEAAWRGIRPWLRTYHVDRHRRGAAIQTAARARREARRARDLRRAEAAFEAEDLAYVAL